MRKWNMMNRRVIVALLTLGSLICMNRVDVFAQEAKVKTTGKPVQNAFLVSSFPQTKADSPRGTEETLEGDMLLAKRYNDLGVMYSEKREYDLAISEFNKALEVCPMLTETYNNRGITYAKKGQYDLAISDFTRALEIKPDIATVHFNRGITYAQKGKYALAFQDFDRSLELDPINAPAYANRGSVHAHLACSDWEKACRLGDCIYLEEAVKIGLCIKLNENSTSSP